MTTLATGTQASRYTQLLLSRRSVLRATAIASAALPFSTFGDKEARAAQISITNSAAVPASPLDSWVSTGLSTIIPHLQNRTHTVRHLHTASSLLRMLAKHAELNQADDAINTFVSSLSANSAINGLPQAHSAQLKSQLLAQDPTFPTSQVDQIFQLSPTRVSKSVQQLKTFGYSGILHRGADFYTYAAQQKAASASPSAAPTSWRIAPASQGHLQDAIYYGDTAPHLETVSSTYCKLARSALKALGLKTQYIQLSPQDKEGVCDAIETVGDTAALAAVYAAVGGCDLAGVAAAPVSGGVSVAAAAVACPIIGYISGATAAVCLGVLNCAFDC